MTACKSCCASSCRPASKLAFAACKVQEAAMALGSTVVRIGCFLTNPSRPLGRSDAGRACIAADSRSCSAVDSAVSTSWLFRHSRYNSQRIMTDWCVGSLGRLGDVNNEQAASSGRVESRIVRVILRGPYRRWFLTAGKPRLSRTPFGSGIIRWSPAMRMFFRVHAFTLRSVE